MDIQVTSASKRAERLSKTAASVYVITAEDIRRSGLQSLPEVLRLAPGVQVARTSAGVWAISIRGFNDEFANKLLVLVDGRSVYNELFGGVFWDGQATPLDDIERIEIIRGPVAALWGTNAVNGVINIITKSAAETRGGMISIESGTAGERYVNARFGGSLGSNATYRIGVRDSGMDPLHAMEGLAPTEGWGSEGANFRVDWNPDPSDTVTVTGEAYRSAVGHRFLIADLTNPFAPPVNSQDTTVAGNASVHWEHSISERSTVDGQLSWEHTNFSDPQLPLSFNIVNLELKEHTSFGSRQDLILGVSAREASYDIESTPTFAVHPENFLAFTGAAFAEDEITLVADKLELIAGVHFSHNPFTGFEIQPTTRLLWTPNKKSSTWVAISRAVRTPAIYHRGLDVIVMPLEIEPGVFGYPHTIGAESQKSETVVAYEVGERLQPSRRLSIDLSAFYNNYGSLESITSSQPVYVPAQGGLPGYLELLSVLGDDAHGRTFGGDLSVAWTVNSRWKLSGGYSGLHLRAGPDTGVNAKVLLLSNGDPSHQFQIHSALDVTRKWQVDGGLYYTSSSVSTVRGGMLEIPSHTRGDLRIGWRPTERVEISAGVQDAFSPLHLELVSSRFYQPLEVRRNIYGAVRWQF
jgi:iron complex outermembrane receptor protein